MAVGHKRRHVKMGSGALARDEDAERELLHRLRTLNARCRDARDPETILRQALRLSMDFFGASEGCVAVINPGEAVAEIAFSIPREAAWDRAGLGAFICGEKARVDADQMLARVRRRDRRWAALSIRRLGANFQWEARRGFSAIGSQTAELLHRMDLDRLRDIRAKIDRKIMEQIRPKDLSYQILHGLRSLTEYDHSATLLVCDREMQQLEVMAEQIAWRKAKSKHIGRTLPISPALIDLLKAETVFGFDRDGSGWREWDSRAATALAELLDFNRGDLADPDEAVERSMLCAPLVTRDRVLGVVKVAAAHADILGRYEAELLLSFLPQVSVALQNAQRTESLEASVLMAERKHAMADLARGVSHDVNNALGAVLPLVQELHRDAKSGRIDPAVAAEDLREIERSLQVCRRIFSGMLRFARGAMASSGEVNVRQEIDTTLSILKDGLERRRIAVELGLPADLPHVRSVQADVEQLLLNIVSNARDAMPDGGSLHIAARLAAPMIELTIADTGVGIPKRNLAKIQEPFFTTKPSGNGLGLAICRSIISQMGGKMSITSTPGRGTTVLLLLPAAVEEIA